MSHRHDNQHWINPLLSELKLIEIREEVIDPQVLWSQIEQNQLMERICKPVSEINDTAGYHVVEMMEFLPPQNKILIISFERKGIKYKMELVLRNQGIFLVFGSARRSSTGWERYFPQTSWKNNYAKDWEQQVRPAEILEKDIQGWFSYLLSGLDRKFRPDNLAAESVSAETGLDPSLRKASA